MIVKFVRDDLKTFSLGGSHKDTAAWGITKIDGTGNIENEITTEKFALRDGAEITSERIPQRSIDITARVKNRDSNEIERQKAMSFFNPKHSFIIYITKGDVTRWIVAKIQKFKCPEAGARKMVEMSLALICPDPFFYSKDNYGKNIASVTPGFGFPYISPSGRGFNVGVYNFAKQVEIENTGDVETYATIYIEATGEVENPKIIQNGAYIRLIDNLVNGDVIEIDLVGNTIKKNGLNCIGKIDRKSSFTDMAILPGDNTVAFSADNGDSNMNVVLYYNLKYLGA